MEFHVYELTKYRQKIKRKRNKWDLHQEIGRYILYSLQDINKIHGILFLSFPYLIQHKQQTVHLIFIKSLNISLSNQKRHRNEGKKQRKKKAERETEKIIINICEMEQWRKETNYLREDGIR